jgi:glycosyltransferase involved in cell wall biosynthesis
MLQGDSTGFRIGYVLKVYPRFSETFIVTEILAREAAGEQLEIFSLRPAADPRFHPELARVKAPVTYVPRPFKLSEGWEVMAQAVGTVPEFAARYAELLPELAPMDPDEVYQGVGLARLVIERRIGHLHAHFGSAAARTAEIAARLAGITYSFTMHAKDIFHESVDYARLRQGMKNADHVITISAYNYRFLRNMFSEETRNLHLVYNGLELERFPFRPPDPPDSVLRVAAVGRLVEKKGFSMLVDAAEELAKRGRRVEVRIAGDGDLAEDLAARIAAARLEDTVFLLGPQTQQEVFELLRWADVLAAPCIVGADGNADGLPTVLLEAMAMGVPAIASDVTGIPEVVHPADGAEEQTGVLVRAGVLPDLVTALETVAGPDFDRGAVAAAARRLIEADFDSHRQAAQLRGLLSHAAGPAEPAASGTESAASGTAPAASAPAVVPGPLAEAL